VEKNRHIYENYNYYAVKKTRKKRNDTKAIEIHASFLKRENTSKNEFKKKGK